MSNMFKPFEITKVLYTRKDHTDGGERVIIPTFVPLPAMKAVDVTDLSEEERVKLLNLLKEYSAYFEAASQRVFSFEDWLTHTANGEDWLIHLTGETEGPVPAVKWRTFLLENTKAVK